MFGDPSPSRRLYDAFAAEENAQVEQSMKNEVEENQTLMVSDSGVTGGNNLDVATDTTIASRAAVNITDESKGFDARVQSTVDESPSEDGEKAYNLLKSMIEEEAKERALKDASTNDDYARDSGDDISTATAGLAFADGAKNNTSSSSQYSIFGSGPPVKFDERSGSKEAWRPAFGTSTASFAPIDALAVAAALTNNAGSNKVHESSFLFGSKENQTVGSFSTLASLASVGNSACGDRAGFGLSASSSQPFGIAPVGSDQSTGIFGKVADSTSIFGSRPIDKQTLDGKSGPEVDRKTIADHGEEFDSPTTCSIDTNKNEHDQAVKHCTAWTKARRAKETAWKKTMTALNACTGENTNINADDISVAASAATTKQSNVTTAKDRVSNDNANSSANPTFDVNPATVSSAGSTSFAFKPTPKLDGTSTIMLQSITGMFPYKDVSFEGLRLADYSVNNKFNASASLGSFQSPNNGNRGSSHAAAFSFGCSTETKHNESLGNGKVPPTAPVFSFTHVSFSKDDKAAFSETGCSFRQTPASNGFLFSQSNPKQSVPAAFSQAPAPAPAFSFISSSAPVDTSLISFQPSLKQDGSTNITLHSITAMSHYEKASIEELRLADYLIGNKGSKGQQQIWRPADGRDSAANASINALAPAPFGKMFGSFGSSFKPTATATAGSFGCQETAQPSSGLCGAPAQAPFSAGLFGAPAPAPTNGGLFGFPTESSNEFTATTQVPSFGARKPWPTASGSDGSFGSPIPPKTFQFGATSDTSASYSREEPAANHTQDRYPGEIKALKERLKTAKMFEEFAKKNFFQVCKLTQSVSGQECNLEKEAKTGFLKACEEAEAAEACLNAALHKWGLGDADGEATCDGKKRAVSPVNDVENRQFKRPRF